MKRSEGAAVNREKLILAATHLFQTKGYFATEIKEISAKAGLGTGTFYNYFSDKKMLYLAVFEQEFRRIGSNLFSLEAEELLKELPLKKVVAYFVKKQFKAHTHSALFYREAAALIALDDEVRALNTALETQMKDKVLELFFPFLPGIHPEEGELMIEIIFSAMEENLHRLVEVRDEKRIKHSLAELSQMIIAYLEVKIDETNKTV